jgi:hypothetical protein
MQIQGILPRNQKAIMMPPGTDCCMHVLAFPCGMNSNSRWHRGEQREGVHEAYQDGAGDHTVARGESEIFFLWQTLWSRPGSSLDLPLPSALPLCIHYTRVPQDRITHKPLLLLLLPRITAVARARTSSRVRPQPVTLETARKTWNVMERLFARAGSQTRGSRVPLRRHRNSG